MYTHTVNIAKNVQTCPFYSPMYRHFFRVVLDSVTGEKLKEVVDSLAAAYPAPDFNVTVSLTESTGRDITHDFSSLCR